MKMSKVIEAWDAVLKVYCNCFPDANGNRQCDNGQRCENDYKCYSRETQEAFNTLLEDLTCTK